MKTQINKKENNQPGINHGFRREVDCPFVEAVQRTRAALASEGFRVLSELDVRETLKEKLGVDLRNYMILGACVPRVAFDASNDAIDAGNLPTYNVILHEQDSTTVVAAIDTAEMMAVGGNEDLSETARIVNEKFRRMIKAV